MGKRYEKILSFFILLVEEKVKAHFFIVSDGNGSPFKKKIGIANRHPTSFINFYSIIKTFLPHFF